MLLLNHSVLESKTSDYNSVGWKAKHLSSSDYTKFLLSPKLLFLIRKNIINFIQISCLRLLYGLGSCEAPDKLTTYSHAISLLFFRLLSSFVLRCICFLILFFSLDSSRVYRTKKAHQNKLMSFWVRRGG